MQNALLSCIFLSIGCAPIGVFLQLRKMSLVGEALSHGIFPGLVISYIFFGSSIIFMMFFGCIAGLCLVFLARFITKYIGISEDNSFASIYIIFLALGNLILSLKARYFDISCFLFGSIFGIDSSELIKLCLISVISSVILIYFYRGMLIAVFDEKILNSFCISRSSAHFIKINIRRKLILNSEFYHMIFYILLCLNIVSAFQSFGTILSVGVIVLPGIIARIFCQSVLKMIVYSVIISCICQYFGLILSYYFDLPASSTIIIVFGFVYFVLSFFKMFFQNFYKKNSIKSASKILILFLIFSQNFHTNSEDDRNIKKESYKIFCTFSILEDITQNIIIDTPLKVYSIIPNHHDPHSYDLSANEMRFLSEASMIIINGLNLEKFWLKKIINNVSTDQMLVYASDGVIPEHYTNGEINPHAWLSVLNAIIYVKNICAALIKKYPEYKEIFEKNSMIYIKKLYKLHNDLLKIWRKTPQNIVIFFSNGDLSGYYEKAYNIKIVNIRLLENSNDINFKMIKNLKNSIKKSCHNYIFIAKFDENFVKKILKILIYDMTQNDKNRFIVVKESISTDFLGESINYIEFMLKNTRVFSENIKIHN